MEAPGRGSKGDSRGLNRVLRSFAYAWEGRSYVYSTQANMRIHVLFAALAGVAWIAAGVGRARLVGVGGGADDVAGRRAGALVAGDRWGCPASRNTCGLSANTRGMSARVCAQAAGVPAGGATPPVSSE